MTDAAHHLQPAFAPGGTLRASINLGNPLLANRKPDGEVFGVSIDLARELAERLGLSLELVVFDKAKDSVEAVEAGHADIGFFAIDPRRGEHVAFTPPYADIEGSYLVRADSPLQSNEQVDAEGIRVVVGAGSAYDLFLTRSLSRAQIVRAASSQAVVDTFLAQNLEVAAGVKQPLQADAERVGGLRLLPGRFMVIQQAMGIPKVRGREAHEYLSAFVEDMKASGFVARALQTHRIKGAVVAAAGPAHD